MNVYLYSFLFFWLLHILRRTFFWLYFWQLKEYRWDRFKDGIQENKKILFPKVSIFALTLLLFSPLLLKILDGALFEIFTFVFYFTLGIYSLYLLLKRKWSLPKFTSKMLVLFILTFLLETTLIIVPNQSLETRIFSLTILILEVFFPLFMTFCVEIVQIPTFFAKKWIIKKAGGKMKNFPKLTVIGITGSYGKTSTKEFLAQILSQKYKVLKTEGNNNTEMGVSRTVLQKLNKKHQIFVCEMAAYRKGEIKAICDIVHPKIGILTGVTTQHISLFGSLKNIVQTKYELINSLPKDGIAIFNATNKECQKLAQRTTVQKYLYSAYEGDFDVFARNINETKDFIEFELVTKKEKTEIRLNLLGKQNVENFLGAATCALKLGISLKEIQKIAPKLQPSETSLRKKESKNGAIIIDDSYSQNPEGVMAAMDYLKNFENEKKILLMPCLIELGKSAPAIHKNIGRKIGETFDFAIITTPYYFEELTLGAQEAGMKPEKIIFLSETKKVLEKLGPYLQKGNVILIEGRINEKIKEKIVNKSCPNV
ncbi:MAG TPA: UDP-N-acetylmuramoyl-tripeptide--D-alanyl-D-alanine ligase [Candidatus Pacearchaeota archaeon]|nr:UDP-N-acetylmuramoyl-tripeptide--D-alanyl-D-alanine ligase [Candidatus Pacearchaeota archaeon]HOK94297.1 UDP-N-acetylmuramoyl-tripeptide--D-alanyl-D-alanine ligase [Candidatus Pacearchaeota archaeon]HPO75427.1 UDP-N-acetylmuramoyl-tripeptide--D-alanyl-D-alanine ligase [Candidatus Pacearchaeota archaeon]